MPNKTNKKAPNNNNNKKTQPNFQSLNLDFVMRFVLFLKKKYLDSSMEKQQRV